MAQEHKLQRVECEALIDRADALPMRVAHEVVNAKHDIIRIQLWRWPTVTGVSKTVPPTVSLVFHFSESQGFVLENAVTHFKTRERVL